MTLLSISLMGIPSICLMGRPSISLMGIPSICPTLRPLQGINYSERGEKKLKKKRERERRKKNEREKQEQREKNLRTSILQDFILNNSLIFS